MSYGSGLGRYGGREPCALAPVPVKKPQGHLSLPVRKNPSGRARNRRGACPVGDGDHPMVTTTASFWLRPDSMVTQDKSSPRCYTGGYRG